ncbi:MAG: DUF4254 domain-containing protein [Alphaproteobacteria bacterium]|nr:DUF4254 domain-containing protein [Alphaproteobacteria bacterium]
MDKIIDIIIKMQENHTEEWHKAEEEFSKDLNNVNTPEEILYNYVKANHLMNFRLWHTEDIARRKDVSSKVIADCKYKIDELNQMRTNFYECIDAAFTKLLKPKLPQVCEDVQNTETLGMVIDRLSILSLKIYHMNEQKMRTDTSTERVKQAADKLGVLLEQKTALVKAVKYLIKEYISGKKKIAAYYQFKMYNDPELNPQLYKHKGENNDERK